MTELLDDRPYHHGNLRAALLEAAEASLAEHGADGISLRDLAREIGVSHGAPRRHFPDRQALLDALAISGFVRLDEQIRQAIDAVAADFPSRLHAVARAYTRFATENAALLELMYSSKHRPGAEGIVEASEAAFRMVFDLLKQGQDEGALGGEDPTETCMVLFATLQGIATMTNAGFVPGEQLEALTDTAVTQFLRGARP
ncbi:TetR family transcriptional regulator [Brachybacterium endophyticum]|uniref:TetR family transcriptional regulator n=1 Tax=Brachybacterium endophyticum TaxID=2182385 RepID=A0A2U2RJA7_9MICO|nr:TetR/AcrR family transcriptional regulator [Brachybacterium endophyticum]PWH05940.1 TetR family transcriptional regulator [Brachybacterium endophyticum]